MKDAALINQTTRRALVWLLLACVIVNPFLFIWQWGDFTDTGYHATLIQNFADDITQNIVHSEAVLSFFLGYVWLYLFPDSGLLGLSCLAAGIVVLISLAPLVALTRATDKTITVLFGVFAAQSYYIRVWLSFGYDDVALLFLAWAATCMICFVSNNKKIFIWLSGFLVSAAFFARLPSITGISLIVIPWFTNLVTESANGIFREYYKNFLIVGIRQSFLFLSGVIYGLLVGICTMWILGVSDIYWRNLVGFSVGAQEGGSYSVIALLYNYLIDFKRMLWPWFVLVLLWLLASFAVLRNEVSKLLRWSYLMGLLLIVILSIRTNPAPSYMHPIKYLVLAVFIVIAAYLLKNYRKLNPTILASLLAGICIATVAIVGSNTGFLKTQAGMFFLIPASLVGVSQFRDHKWYGLNVPWLRICYAITVVVLVSSLVARAFYVYHASKFYTDRLRFLHRIEISNLAGLRTSPERAEFLKIFNQKIREIPRNLSLYVYGHTPILYFVSERKPFIQEIWLANKKYFPKQILQSLERKSEASGVLPVVVVTDRTILGEAGWKEMDKFFYRHSYTLKDRIKSADGLTAEIYLPPKEANVK